MYVLGRAKAMMTERLAVSEAKLLKIPHDDAVQTLVETKLTLAQSEFQTLELQVCYAMLLLAVLCCLVLSLLQLRD